MREIKFRAWNKTTKEMLYNEFHVTANGEVVSFGETLNAVLMQFTGLLDRNGKEIWEGDLVVQDGYLWFDNGKPNYRGTVEWIYSEWQVVAHCINSSKAGISDGINEGLNDDGIDEGEKSNWKVIGNVFENPDLLEAPDA